MRQFFENNSKQLSSKRLGYLASLPFSCFGTIWICNKLIDSGNPALAVDVWNSFLIFSAVLGGFVSAEMLIPILNLIRGKSNVVSSQPTETESIPTDSASDSLDSSSSNAIPSRKRGRKNETID